MAAVHIEYYTMNDSINNRSIYFARFVTHQHEKKNKIHSQIIAKIAYIQYLLYTNLATA